jgi:hypothetical protein
MLAVISMPTVPYEYETLSTLGVFDLERSGDPASSVSLLQSIQAVDEYDSSVSNWETLVVWSDSHGQCMVLAWTGATSWGGCTRIEFNLLLINRT